MDNGTNERITERRSSIQLVRDAYRLIERCPFKLLFFPFILVWLFYYGFLALSQIVLKSYDLQLVYVGFCIAFVSYLIVGTAINLIQRKEHWFFRDTMKLIVSFFKPMMLIGTVLLIVSIFGLGQPEVIGLKIVEGTVGRIICLMLLFICLYCYSLLVYREQGNIASLKSLSNYVRLLVKDCGYIISIIIITSFLGLLIIALNTVADNLLSNPENVWQSFFFNPDLFCQMIPFSERGAEVVNCPSTTNIFINSFLFFYVYALAIVAMTLLWEANRPADETPEIDSEEEIKADFKDKVNQALFGNNKEDK